MYVHHIKNDYMLDVGTYLKHQLEKVSRDICRHTKYLITETGAI